MRIWNPETLAKPRGYNNGVSLQCGQVLFIAGQVGWDANGVMADGLEHQFDVALQNVLEVVRAAGGGSENIGRFTIFIKDKANYVALRKEIGTIYRKHMGKHFPAMSLVVVQDLLEDRALVEIEATAVIA